MNVLVFNLRQDADDAVLGFTTDWVNALAQRCDEIVVITMAVGSISVRPNVAVFSIGGERGRSKLRRAAAFYSLLWKVLRTRRIDVCFAHMNHIFALMGAPLLKAFGVPTMLWYAHKSVTWQLRVAEMLVDVVVSSSPTGFQLPSRKLAIVGQGIDTTRFTPGEEPRSSGPLILLSFGRISRVKRLEIIVEALAQLQLTEPDLSFECRIVGDPLDLDGTRYLAELKTLVGTLGLCDRISFLPGVAFHQAHSMFTWADIFLNPSDTDSVDKTGLEALSCAVPIITSNLAFRDILPPAIGRIALVPKNDPRAFAAAIAKIAGWSAQERRAFRSQSRNFVVAEHSIDGLADKLVARMRALA